MANKTSLVPIINSALSLESALLQNPLSPAPQDVVEAQVLLEVDCYGFDDLLHHGQIVVHMDVASDVIVFFELALALKFPIQSVIPIADERFHFDDELSCNQNNTSGYNYRTIMGADKLSKHALGLAFDVNPVQNIYVRYGEAGNEIYRLPAGGTYNKFAAGTLTKHHPLVTLMEKRGWFWGGNWGPRNGLVDYQHFEKTSV